MEITELGCVGGSVAGEARGVIVRNDAASINAKRAKKVVFDMKFRVPRVKSPS